jgi:hypothetical protein
MQKAYLHLIKYALANNATVSVHDSEEWAAKRSTSYNEIKHAIESVDISDLRIRDKDTGEVLGWAGIVLERGQRPDESVYDCEVCPFMDAWDAAYRAESNQ